MYECARLCGCRIILAQDQYTKEEWSQYEPGMYGINWGKDEGKKLPHHEFSRHYRKMVTRFEKKLDLFIQETQS